jgi:hypothetical protein
MIKPGKFFGIRIENVKAIHRSHPNPAFGILCQGIDVIIGNACAVAFFIRERFKSIAVELAEAVFGAYPHKPVAAFDHRCGIP